MIELAGLFFIYLICAVFIGLVVAYFTFGSKPKEKADRE